MLSLSQLQIPSCQEVGLDAYAEFAQKQTILNPEEERDNAIAVQKEQDGNALKKLVCSNLKAVVPIANAYLKYYNNLAALIDAGNIGLIRAAFKYNSKTPATFAQQAVYFMRVSILQVVIQPIRDFAEKYKGKLPRMDRQEHFLERYKAKDLYSQVLLLKHYQYVPQLLLAEFEHQPDVDTEALLKIGKDSLNEVIGEYFNNPYHENAVKYTLEEHLLYYTYLAMKKSLEQ